MDKRRLYSILYLICLVLLINSLPFGLIIKDEVILFIINLIIKVVSIFYILRYIKKEGLNQLNKEKLNKDSVKLIPLLVLCASNFFVVLFQQTSLKTNINMFNIITGLVISVGVGIVEELLFRSQVLEEFLKHVSKPKALIYSSLIFGSVHLLNISSLASIPVVLVQVFYTAFLGLVLGFVYLSSKNIILPILFHILFNFINDILVVELFSMKWDVTFFIVNLLVGLVVVLYIIIISKIKERKDHYASTNLDN